MKKANKNHFEVNLQSFMDLKLFFFFFFFSAQLNDDLGKYRPWLLTGSIAFNLGSIIDIERMMSQRECDGSFVSMCA